MQRTNDLDIWFTKVWMCQVVMPQFNERGFAGALALEEGDEEALHREVGGGHV